ncbi:MAG: 16S rRNA (guanine(966)-N(2))-methyltransferase RsmD [Phycisphaeraceae bacterium]|nr:16S rRNA (guanine(966)-N(2))-methyltransferase RsmD [Phycisphaeraceae bacterium]
MRIIAGEFRSRKLQSPPEGSTTRPMPDRVRESLFSLLRGHLEGASVLDAFAGTGSVGLEAASRGAARVVMIERDRRVAQVLQSNVELLGCEDRCEVAVADVLGLSALSRCPRPVDLVFFDPPYDLVEQGRPGGGWDRVKDQFGRFVELLAETGFGVLRTPWPFRHFDNLADEDQHIQVAEEARRRARGGRRHGPGHTEHLSMDSEIEDPVLEDDWDGEDGAAGEPDKGAPPVHGPPKHMVDLKIPGAVGPETHIYRHTALHLYMRRREA